MTKADGGRWLRLFRMKSIHPCKVQLLNLTYMGMTPIPQASPRAGISKPVISLFITYKIRWASPQQKPIRLLVQTTSYHVSQVGD